MRVVVLLLFLLLPAGVLAACLEDAALSYNLSPLLLEAIKEVESGGNPYALNIQLRGNGRELERKLLELGVPYKVSKGRRLIVSVFPASRQQAERVIELILNTPGVRTFDVGLMQINKLWIDKFGLRPEWLLEPCYNAKWGAYVLSTMVARYGYTWEAVWHYNGRPDYALKVFRKLRELCKSSSSPYCKKIINGEVNR